MPLHRDSHVGQTDGIPRGRDQFGLAKYKDWLPQVRIFGGRDTGRTNLSHLMDDDLDTDYEDIFGGIEDECPYD